MLSGLVELRLFCDNLFGNSVNLGLDFY